MILRFFKTVVFFGLFLSTSSLYADEKIDCTDGGNNTYEMNYCADLDYQKEDKKLNDTYQKVIKQIQTQDDMKEFNPQLSNENWLKALKKSQKAWIALRDSDCEDLVIFEGGGGTITTAMVLGCLIDHTKKRTKFLQSHFLNEH